MYLKEFFDYKNLLMKELCSNENIVRMVTNNEYAVVPNHGLPYTQIFPYEYVPETVDDAKTFICFDVDIVRVPNKTFYMPVLYLWLFTHKSLLRQKDGGLLLDNVSQEIDQMLNGSKYFGMGDLNLESVTRFAPILDYQGRVLTYSTVDWNRPVGPRKSPTNRKGMANG